MKKNNRQHGFTLIELMVVITIIGILAATAIPPYLLWAQSAKVTEAIQFAQQLQGNINDYYKKTARFPVNNAAAGLPEAEKLISPDIAGIEVQNGVLQVKFRQATQVHNALRGKQFSLRPVYVEDSPKTPISWICGNAAVPQGMTAAGENHTDIPPTFLPVACRDLTGKQITPTAADIQNSSGDINDKGDSNDSL